MEDQKDTGRPPEKTLESEVTAYYRAIRITSRYALACSGLHLTGVLLLTCLSNQALTAGFAMAFALGAIGLWIKFVRLSKHAARCAIKLKSDKIISGKVTVETDRINGLKKDTSRAVQVLTWVFVGAMSLVLVAVALKSRGILTGLSLGVLVSSAICIAFDLKISLLTSSYLYFLTK